MSINGLPLAGWDETSTWGVDGGTYYAQLTPNGISDVDGPQILIAPLRDVVHEVSALASAIAAATDAPADEVLAAMRRGAGPEDRPALDLLPPSVPVPRSEQATPVRDLSAAVAGQGITREATRRRMTEGTGADRSWRVGADGEFAVGALLAELTEPSRRDRLRGRRPEWRVWHGVPLGDGHGNERGDIDHLLVGPPGVITINTKHHRTGKLTLDGDEFVLNGRRTDYIPKARREADRTSQMLDAALGQAAPALAGRVVVRPMVVIVSGRLMTRQWASGVLVVMTDRLLHTLRALPRVLDPGQLDFLSDIAQKASTWNPPGRD